MSADQIILLVVLIIVAAAAAVVAYLTAYPGRSILHGPPTDPAHGRGQGHEPADHGLAVIPIRGRGTLIPPTSTRQVARVVAFLFLAAVAVIVALSGAWSGDWQAIVALLAGGFLLVVLFMDLVPPSVLGRWRRPLEGIGATLFLGLLMLLTGGADSPFVVGFYLVAAGTALSVEGRAPLAIALAGAATIVAVGLLEALVSGPLPPEALAWVGINAVALVLLADIATAAARAQRHARDEALRASRFDALTGLYNRAFFSTTIEQELRRSDRMGRGFAMLMLDLDDLKPVNDTFGHQWGDRLLRAIADTIRATIRFTDAAARYGGDEFVVLLPETDAAGGFVVAEKLRRDIASVSLRVADRNVRSSVSIGLVAYPDDGATVEQLVAAADVAMYEAKRRGKNRIVGYQERTERVATDIDADTHVMVQLNPTDEVRTGGDPAPWGELSPSPGSRRTGGAVAQPSSDPGRGEPSPYPGRGQPSGPLPEPPPRRRSRSTIPVEPDPAASAPWWTESTESPDRAAPPEPPPERPASPEPPPGPPPATRPGDGPPEPPRRSRTAVDTPDRAERPDAPDQGDRPWLTRTDAPPERPAADLRTSSGGGGRAGGTGRSGSGSRSDEIRGGDRPWIALPIEPDEGPPRPRS